MKFRLSGVLIIILCGSTVFGQVGHKDVLADTILFPVYFDRKPVYADTSHFLHLLFPAHGMPVSSQAVYTRLNDSVSLHFYTTEIYDRLTVNAVTKDTQVTARINYSLIYSNSRTGIWAQVASYTTGDDLTGKWCLQSFLLGCCGAIHMTFYNSSNNLLGMVGVLKADDTNSSEPGIYKTVATGMNRIISSQGKELALSFHADQFYVHGLAGLASVMTQLEPGILQAFHQ